MIFPSLRGIAFWIVLQAKKRYIRRYSHLGFARRAVYERNRVTISDLLSLIFRNLNQVKLMTLKTHECF